MKPHAWTAKAIGNLVFEECPNCGMFKLKPVEFGSDESLRAAFMQTTEDSGPSILESEAVKRVIADPRTTDAESDMDCDVSSVSHIMRI